jgi:Binding-protein-dependent transport system inner membrane component
VAALEVDAVVVSLGLDATAAEPERPLQVTEAGYFAAGWPSRRSKARADADRGSAAIDQRPFLHPADHRVQHVLAQPLADHPDPDRAVLAYTARLIRGQVPALRPREFVEAARTMGASGRWILTRHMVPNTLGISVVTATFSIADSIYALSALSFLGIGPPPFTDWGTMLSDGVNNLFNGYW